MKNYHYDTKRYEYYEYHGNTAIEYIKVEGNNTILRDWIIFDTVEEAADYFYNDCNI